MRTSYLVAGSALIVTVLGISVARYGLTHAYDHAKHEVTQPSAVAAVPAAKPSSVVFEADGEVIEAPVQTVHWENGEVVVDDDGGDADAAYAPAPSAAEPAVEMVE